MQCTMMKVFVGSVFTARFAYINHFLNIEPGIKDVFLFGCFNFTSQIRGSIQELTTFVFGTSGNLENYIKISTYIYIHIYYIDNIISLLSWDLGTISNCSWFFQEVWNCRCFRCLFLELVVKSSVELRLPSLIPRLVVPPTSIMDVCKVQTKVTQIMFQNTGLFGSLCKKLQWNMCYEQSQHRNMYSKKRILPTWPAFSVCRIAV